MSSWGKGSRTVINGLGEVIRYRPGDTDGELLLGSVNLVELGNRLAASRKCSHGYRPSYVEPTQADVAREFRRQARQELSPAEYALVIETWNKQKLEDGRWRFFAVLMRGRPTVWMTTEFVLPVKSKAVREARKLARDTGGAFDTMFEYTGQEYQDWIGDHVPAVPALQFALNWPVTGLNRRDLRARMRELGKLTDALWEQAGVSVI